MRNRLTTVKSGARVSAGFVPLLLLTFCLVGCGGVSSSSNHPGVPPGPPNLGSLSPASGVFGASVTITGTNFGSSQGSNTVTFNGKTASVDGWSNGEIVATVPSGATTGNVVVTVDGDTSNSLNFTVVALPTGAIAPSYFGFQCGIGDTDDCGNSAGNAVVWPGTQAQPGMLRLHDTGTQWANMDPQGGGVYNWDNLDVWLDAIAAHQPLDVIEVFTWVPCWDAPTCSSPATSPVGTNAPPADLGTGPNGSSPAFNNFVTAFVQHCNSNNHCVKDYIKYYEMWNEWDLQYHWTGTMAQVYQLVSYPALQIIDPNVPDAVILTPSTTPSSDTGVGYQCDFQNWLNYETSNGYISDEIAWHVYLSSPQNDQTQIVSPETQWSNYNSNFLSIQAGGGVSGCATGSPNSRWKTIPWADTETNFNGSPPPGLNYTCPQSSNPNPPVTYSAADCAGQVARWQLLHDSNGAVSLDWYKWNETIGSNPQYEPIYYWLMQYLVSGTFTGPCSFTAANGASTWTCPFTEGPPSNTQALWVWTPNEAGTSYTVPSGYLDYRDLAGNTTNVSTGQTITIGVQPFMLEQ